MTGNFTCPVDGTKLVPMERAGIEIDHCPSCRGVWLDRGELDKILERNAAPTAQSQPAPAPWPEQQRPRYDDRQQQHHGGHYGHHGQKKRKSFLEELFD